MGAEHFRDLVGNLLPAPSRRGILAHLTSGRGEEAASERIAAALHAEPY